MQGLSLHAFIEGVMRNPHHHLYDENDCPKLLCTQGGWGEQGGGEGRVWKRLRGGGGEFRLWGHGATQSATCCTMCKRGRVGIVYESLSVSSAKIVEGTEKIGVVPRCTRDVIGAPF